VGVVDILLLLMVAARFGLLMQRLENQNTRIQGTDFPDLQG
jgi:hypothetical protein